MTPTFNFDNTYARDLDGFYAPWTGDAVPAPKIIQLNHDLAVELGLDPDALDTDEGAAILAGSHAPDGAIPLAMAYAGHQFGGFSPQLGDGRAILLGEVIDTNGHRQDIHLKGSGRTPFSRGGDGKAVIGPVLREYLMGEAMHALSIPTTRALAAVTTGEDIMREGPKPGAVLARVASSHLRVGTFQFFAARGETEKVRQLADYAIARHYPDLADHDDRYIRFLRRVIEVQTKLVARWVLVGFIHGVMNTDNMTISGETIDYGPCAFLDSYGPDVVFSSIDHQGRYAYGNQPNIAQWNLARLAESLLDLINPDDTDDAIRQATNEINTVPALYQRAWLEGMREKLGILDTGESDLDLANDLFETMVGQSVDFTLLFRHLATALRGEEGPARALFDDPSGFDAWMHRWTSGLKNPDASADSMDKVNPIYIPRNHLVEEALTLAQAGDMSAFNALSDVLKTPFERTEIHEKYANPAPDGFGPHKTFCGT